MHFWKSLALLAAAIIPAGHGAVVSSAAPSKWVHPGAMISQSQLDFIKQKVQDGEQPWTDAYEAMLKDETIDRPSDPSPPAIVECGPYSDPDIGCKAERQDALAAYGNALAWAVGDSKERAQRAIDLMDTYSSTIKGHNNSNAPLQSGWVGSVWARAGEIIRHTDAGWSEGGIEQFESMLRNAYMPLTVNGTDHNVANWELGKGLRNPQNN